MATSEEIFHDGMALPPDARAELTERLVESLAHDISPEIISSQFAEVRRRIAQVESGEVELIRGDEALARERISSQSIWHRANPDPAFQRQDYETLTKACRVSDE